jgi:hypothetical protein
MVQRLSQRAEVNWLPQSEMMTANMPYLTIQPCVRMEAQDFEEISDKPPCVPVNNSEHIGGIIQGRQWSHEIHIDM